MDVEIVRQAALVKEVSGEVLAVAVDGQARKLTVGDSIELNEIIIASNQAQLLVESFDSVFQIQDNCVSCQDDAGAWHTASIDGEVNFDYLPETGEDAPIGLDEDELAAIQEAILAGADPTELLEASAAGAGGLGSANGGFVTIARSGAELLASTNFETSGFFSEEPEDDRDNDLSPFIFASGGESLTVSLSEGSLSSSSLGYPSSSSTSVTIFAGGLSLDPDSFVPTSSSLSSLLAELNSDITSAGQAVSFSYNADTNTIVGQLDGRTVLSIDIEASSLGKDVSLELTTTIFEPIDHSSSVGGGQVSFANDQITVSIEIEGADAGGNPTRLPIEAQVTIADGLDPVIDSAGGVNVSESLLSDGSQPTGEAVAATGNITFSEGGDYIAAFRVEADQFNTNGELKSGGLVVELREEPTGSGSYIGFTTDSDNNETQVFTLRFDDAVKGEYTFTLLEAIDHANADGNNDYSFTLPVYAVDTDGDTSATSTLSITVKDDVQVMHADQNLNVSEPDNGSVNTVSAENLFEANSADGAKITQFVFGDYDAETLDPDVTGEQKFSFAEGDLYITVAGEMRFEPARNLDHTDGDIVRTIVLMSGDFDKDAATTTVTLTITDGDQVPVIDDIPSVKLSESDLADGSAPTSSPVSFTDNIDATVGSDDIARFRIGTDEFNPNGTLKSGGLEVEIREDPVGSGNYIGFTTDTDKNETQVFTVSFDATDKGKYTFTLLEAMDHADAAGNNNLGFNLPVYAVDTDGDNSVMKPLAVTIEDDVQGMKNHTLSISEPDHGTTTTTDTVDVMPKQSADGAKITQFVFGDYDAETLKPDVTGEQKFSFVEGDLYITIEGNMRFEPARDLNHKNGDIVKSIVVTSGDFDKDAPTAMVTLTIKDGDNPVIGDVTSVTLSETELNDGSAPSNSPVSFTDTIGVTVGGDDIARFRIGIDEFNPNGTLKSGGLEVELREDPVGSGNYIGFTTDTDRNETQVFTVSFDATDKGKYTFTLLEALDHADAAGNNNLSFNLPIYAVDTDGDNSVMKPLSVTIEDDVQGMKNHTLSISEPNDGVTTLTDTVDVMPKQSADGAKITQFVFGDYDAETLDPDVTGEQKFSFAEGDLYITVEGNMRFEPARDLNHKNGDIVKSIVVTSGDFDKDAPTATVTLTIKDGDNPVIGDVPSVTLSETELSDGSAPSSSPVSYTDTIGVTVGGDDIARFRIGTDEFNPNGTLKSGGLEVELREDPVGSGNYIGFTTDTDRNETQVFTVSFDATDKAKYTFTLLEALDHADAAGNNTLSFNLPIYAVDTDGDNSVMKPLSVTIEDDVQGMKNHTLSIAEPNDGATTSTDTVDVMPKQSADGAKITQFVFGDYDAETLKPDVTGEQKFSFAEGDLYITIEGNMRFEPARDLNHTNGDIVKSIVVTSGDFDKDAPTATVTLTIKDGANPVIDDVPSVNLSEVNLGDGSSPTNTPVSYSDTIDVTVGGDDIARFRIGTDEFNPNGTLKSGGIEVELREDPVGSGNYIGFTTDTDKNETQVFTVSFDASEKGKYTFTLLEALDHADAAGSNTLSFNLPVYAVDTDGDNSLMSPLKVTITDDVPVIESLASGSTVQVSEDVLGSDAASINGAFTTTEGADHVARYELINLSTTESGLKSGDVLVSITKVTGVDGATTYQGKVGNESVFTLVLNHDGTYTYTQQKPIDHPEGEDSWTIPFDVVAIDKDGDVSEPLRLPIEVLDDKPTLNGFDGQTTVDEDDLPTIGSDRSDATHVSGTFDIDDGADGVVEYELVNADAILSGLQSGGEGLQWAALSVSGSVYTYMAQTLSGESVFTMTFDANSDSYRFELLKPLDHVSGNEQNTQLLNFEVVATDFDGDVTTKITLPISVIDDVPKVTEQSITRVEGQGFGGSVVNMFESAPDKGADDATLTSIQGSTDSNGASIVFQGPKGTYLNSVDLNEGRQNVRVYEQTTEGDTTDTRLLGVLRINSNGEVEFKASNYLEHDGDTISFKVNVTATDGDSDVSVAPLNITITDKEATAMPLKVQSFEDAGRDAAINYADGDAPERENIQDNQGQLADSPTKIALKVNLYDADNNEEIHSLIIKDGTHRGTFYYEENGVYHKLEANSDGDIVFDSHLLQSSSLDGKNTIATIENLYFVPDRNYSTGDGGVRINYDLVVGNNGNADHTISSNFKVEIESVADIATWNDDNSTYHYSVGEDGDNVQIQLRADTQDTSNPETITYELTPTVGADHFTLLDRNGNVIEPVDGAYLISARDINRIEVNPDEHYSGQIRFQAVAITEESRNEYINGSTNKKTTRSEPQELIIDVTPDADAGNFSVSRIKINEDNVDNPDYIGDGENYEPFTLSEVITMSPSADTDGSESLHVRISNMTEGATLKWVGDGDSQIETITIKGVVYQEVPYDLLDEVEVIPAKDSNNNFKFDVTGVVKDSALLSSGLTHVDEETLGTKTVNVEVTGVADVPRGNTIGSEWTGFRDGDVSGVQITIQENEVADLDFTVVSGETSLDGSESITVLLSNIPEGVVIEDGDNNVIDLNFAGYETGADGNPDLSKPIYEANITGLNNTSGIVVKPVSSSTENIHIKATIIVTENDGHTLSFDQEVRVNVAPVIDTDAEYSNVTRGREDSPINIDWHPAGTAYSDSDEHFTSIVITGVPDEAAVKVNGAVDWNFDSDSGTITIRPLDGQTPAEFTQLALKNNFIQITPPKDSSTDFKLSTTVEIEERDHEYTSDNIVGEGGRVTATIKGEITVKVTPIVEEQDNDNKLVVQNENDDVLTKVVADADGVIHFTINEASSGTLNEHVIRYQETDATDSQYESEELVTQLVVQFDESQLGLMDQLFITGAVYEGGGRWVITNENLFSVKAPNGLDLTPNDSSDDKSDVYNDIDLTIYAQVVDKGDNGNKNGVVAERETTVTLSFPEVVNGQTTVAGVIDIADGSVLTATEDTEFKLGDELMSNSVLTVKSHDDVEDTVTIVIDDSFKVNGETFAISVSGSQVDFTNGKFVFSGTLDSSGNITGLDGLILTLPKDYSGDFKLPITVVTTDSKSGHEESVTKPVTIHVDPIADVGLDASSISIDIVDSLDDQMNSLPQTGAEIKGFEDSYIKLSLGYDLLDKVTGDEGGREVLSEITLTLADGQTGDFYDQGGKNLGDSVTFTQQQIDDGALSNILFKPADNYPTGNDDNTIRVNILGKVTDTAIFNEETSNTTSSHTDSFTSSVSFDVEPVVDGVVVTGSGPNDQTIEFSGEEDQLISLGSSGPVSISLTDTDGSESFVSIKLTNVPEGFLLQTDPNSGYTVKNNGGGEWSVKLPSGSLDTLDLSAISVQPPHNFSGTAEFGIKVYTQESLLGIPTEAAILPNFKLTVTPKGDAVDIDSDKSVSGLEGEPIDININAFVTDNELSAKGSGTFTENAAETIRVEVTNVPDDAQIYYPDGVTLADYDSSTQTWTLDVSATSLDKIIFNSGQHNSDGTEKGINGPIHISVQAVDKDTSGTESLGPKSEFDVALTIDPVNDQPVFTKVENLATSEDIAGGLAITSLTIADVDATYDDPNALYTLTLQADSGTFEFKSDANVTFTIDANGALVIVGKLADVNSTIANGNVIFHPAANSNDLNSNGPVTVTATVDDGGNNGAIDPLDPATASTNQTTFTINVSEVNDAPVAGDLDLGNVAEEGTTQITMAQIIAASSDIDGDTISVESISVPAEQGTLTLNPDGVSWTFEAAQDFNGQVTISYVIEDNGTTNGSNDFLRDSGQISLNVTGVNDKPVIDLTDVTTVVSESSGQLISGIEVSDVDYVGIHSDDLMTVTLSVDYGQLTVAKPAGSGVMISGDGTGSVSVTGTLAELNALITSPTPPSGVYLDASLSPSDKITLDVSAKDSGNPSGLALDADTKSYDILVMPVANAPTLSIDPAMNHVRNIIASQAASFNGIALVGIMAALTDSTETLALEITGLPTGASLTSSMSGITFDPATQVWTVPSDAIADLEVRNAVVGEHTLSVVAVSEESNGDVAKSAPIELSVEVVVDNTDIDQSLSSDDHQLIGEGYDSVLTGGSGDDLLVGGSGNDTLVGGAGDDTLQGGEGNDVLEGGLGSDILTGGTGEDVFIWHHIDDGAVDTITDFSLMEGDKIDLRDVLPELKESNIDMPTLLAQLDAKVVDGDNIELTLHPGGEGSSEQTILVEDLAPQLTLMGNASSDIVSALLDQHVIVHDNV